MEDLARQAEELAHRQQAFEGQMRKAFGQEEPGVDAPAGRPTGRREGRRDPGPQTAGAGYAVAVRDLQSTQRKAATKMREALGELQQAEIERDMQRNADWIRRGMGGYAVMSEATITQGINELREQLKEVQQAVGAGTKDGKGGQDDKLTETALGQVERLRQQLEQLSAQHGRQGQQGQSGPARSARPARSAGSAGSARTARQGQQGQQGQQQGQQGQQGSKQGQQGGGQQSGQMGQANGGPSGQLPAVAIAAAPITATRTAAPGTPTAIRATAPSVPRTSRTTTPKRCQTLRQLEQQAQGNDPAMVKDLQSLIRDMQRLNPNTYANDPLLAARIQSTLMGGIEQVEMELRRKVEDADGTGSVRSPGGEKVPQGYQDKVADYYRKLSKGK